MLTVRLLLINKSNADWLELAIQEYSKRLTKYLKLETKVLQLPKGKSFSSEAEQKKAEAALLLSALDLKEYVILLDENGQHLSSEGFSKHLEKLSANGRKLVFVIGGAYGFDESVYARADAKISLSTMTFSHQMVRVIFLEQLYRAMTILKGEPYHHK